MTCLETTRERKWLRTGSVDKHVKRISVKKREVDKHLGQVCDDWITRIKITADGERLFVGDEEGHLKLISSRDGQVIKDFGRAHYSDITGIIITVDQKFFLTSSMDGELKQWNYEDNTLVRDHGKITARIFFFVFIILDCFVLSLLSLYITCLLYTSDAADDQAVRAS